MAEQYAVDWSTPLIRGFAGGFQYAKEVAKEKEKSESEKIKLWETYLKLREKVDVLPPEYENIIQDTGLSVLKSDALDRIDREEIANNYNRMYGDMFSQEQINAMVDSTEGYDKKDAMNWIGTNAAKLVAQKNNDRTQARLYKGLEERIKNTVLTKKAADDFLKVSDTDTRELQKVFENKAKGVIIDENIQKDQIKNLINNRLPEYEKVYTGMTNRVNAFMNSLQNNEYGLPIDNENQYKTQLKALIDKEMPSLLEHDKNLLFQYALSLEKAAKPSPIGRFFRGIFGGSKQEQPATPPPKPVLPMVQQRQPQTMQPMQQPVTQRQPVQPTKKALPSGAGWKVTKVTNVVPPAQNQQSLQQELLKRRI